MSDSVSTSVSKLGSEPETPKAILLLGATATGKTAVALSLAQQWPIEIISIDSALVYREMDIGTAKPSIAERALVTHHLIDIIDPTESYSTARFANDCRRLVDDIRARKKVPLIVGGTMLYARALMRGLDALPVANPQVRARLDAEAALSGWPAMHEKLAQVDPITAARLPPNDSQRIQRALEVFELSGQAMSSFFGISAIAPLPCTTVSLEPADRAVLHQRIAVRFDAMLTQGFIDEVKALKLRGDLNPELPAMRCVGYRQAWEYLDGHFDLAQLRERGIVATRQLAKRQLTWLRTMPIEHRLEAPFELTLSVEASNHCVNKLHPLVDSIFNSLNAKL